MWGENHLRINLILFFHKLLIKIIFLLFNKKHCIYVYTFSLFKIVLKQFRISEIII